ncbi:MAG: translocation/assembly module TamB domain-containing protein [Gammaproteobacteria bacterium]|nr:translocation/assembly module TamB domain-containing protein [Gammaproteobacteria bacterium]
MTIPAKLRLIALGIILALLAGMLWLLGTESGTRFVLARAEPYLPAGLELRSASGSFFGDVCLETVNWKSESLDVAVRNACVEVEVARLLSRHLAVRSLNVDAIAIVSRPSPDVEPSDDLPSFESPLQISVDSSSLRNISFERDQLARSIDTIRFVGELSASSLDVSQLVLRSNWLNAELDGDIELANLYRSNLNLQWQWTESPSLQLKGSLSLRGDLRRYDLQHRLDAPQQLVTSGSFSYVANELELDLENTWDAFQWEIGESLLQSRNGSLRLQGNLGRLEIALDALGSLDDLPETRVVLDGNTDLESIDFSSLVATNDLGRLAASGNAGWVPTPSFEIEYALSDLDPSLASDLLQGQINASGKASGTFGEDTQILAVTVRELSGLINDQLLAGGGAFTYTPNRLVVTDSRVQLGANRVSVRGTAGDTLSLDAVLELPALQELSPDAAGSLSGSLKLSGSKEKPVIHVEATGSGVAWTDYVIDTISINAAGSLDQHSVQTDLSSAGRRVTFGAHGAYADNRWVGIVDALSIEDKLAGRWSMREAVDLTVSRSELNLSRACLVRSTDASKACAAATVDLEGATSFDLELIELPLAALPLSLPPEVSISGFGNLQAHGSITDGRLTGTGSLALRDASMEAIVDEEKLSAVLGEATGQVTVTDNRLESSLRLGLADGAGNTQIDLDADDIFDWTSAVSGRGELVIKDMSLFAVLIPDIVKPRGLISGKLDISGSFAQPELLGAVSITDGAFGVRRAGIEISELNASVSQTDVGHLRLEGSAHSGGGQINIQGDTWVSADTGVRSELLITGQDFELSRLPDWQVAASPSIAMVFDDYKTTVTGNLFIPSTNVRIKEIPESAVSPSPDALVHREENVQPATRREIHIDVAVGLGEDVLFSGFGLSTGIEGAVRLRGGTHTPLTGQGTLSLRDGIYKAYGQELEIERGRLIFNGPLDNPQLDIRAVRRTTDVLAGIQLTGTPLQLRSNVFSEPPLRDAEALSYLLTGRPLAGATSSGDGDMLNAAAFSLGISGAANIVSQVRSGLGLETLTVEGGAEDGRLIAGKRFGDRLLVEYGYGLIDKLGTLLLRYQLTDRLVLESRTGTVSNFDILYKVKKK